MTLFLGDFFPKDLWPVAGSIIICILTGIFSWWQNRPKNKSDQFSVFMKESSEFRVELRSDNARLKSELEGAKLLIKNLEQQLATCQKQYLECLNRFKDCERRLVCEQLDMAQLKKSFEALLEKKE